MKIWVILFLGLLLPSVDAKDISIPELFEIEQSFVEGSKEIYYYAGTKLIAIDGEYQYQDRLNSDFGSRSLPFGQALNVDNRFSFTGKELDQDLYYFNARYYSPELGKFTSVDPVKENHAYSYVADNPMNYVDPTGMEGNAVLAVNSGLWGGKGVEMYRDQLSKEGYNVQVVDFTEYDFSYDLLEGVSGIDLLVVANDMRTDPNKASRWLGQPHEGLFNEEARSIFLISHGRFQGDVLSFVPSSMYWDVKYSLENSLAHTSPVPYQVGGPFMRMSTEGLYPSQMYHGASHHRRSVKPKTPETVMRELVDPQWSMFYIRPQPDRESPFYDFSIRMTYYRGGAHGVHGVMDQEERITLSSNNMKSISVYSGEPGFNELYSEMQNYAIENPKLSGFTYWRNAQ